MRTGRSLLGLLAFLALTAGCVGSLDGGPAGSGPREPLEPRPVSSGLRRLTVVQYDHSIRDLLGDDVQVAAAIDADPVSAEGFELSDVMLATAPAAAQSLLKFDQAAHTAAGVVFGDPARAEAFVGCAPAHADDPCVRTFLERFLRRAFRRPPEDEHVDEYVALVGAGEASLGTVSAGLALAVAAALESPFFLYRSEIGSVSPDDDDGVRRYDDWEMASRLSYFLWDTTPDDALLDAAARGELTTDAGLGRQLERLLASPRADGPVMRFFGEWLGLDGLDRLAKSPAEFPAFTPTLGPAMRREIEAVIRNELIVDDGSILDLFTVESTYVDAELARLYGLDAPDAGATGPAEQLELEALSPGGCATVEGFANLCYDTEIDRPITVAAAGRHRLSVRAYGTVAGSEQAVMAFSVDGVVLGTGAVSGTEAAPIVITYETELAAGAHVVTLAFTNDFYEAPLNRDLRVDWLRIEAASASEMVRVALPPERRGLLTLGGIMARYAQTIDTSAVQRGLLVRERMLCDHIAAPPSDVETTLPASPSGMRLTTRERLVQHQQEERCAACHSRMDPLGLPLEHFDGLGAFRADDHGRAIDASGELDGTPFDGALELGSLLAESPRVRECIARQMVRQATGVHEHHVIHQGSIDAVETAAAAQGFTLDALISEIVMSEVFRTAGEAR